MHDITLQVNGQEHRVAVDARRSLLDAVREDVGLTGSKKGCDHGQCGACTMIVNGQRINSCLTLAIMHDCDEVTTVEGLRTEDALSPLQRAFVKHDAFQCGFCTPGQLCSATALIEEIRQGLPSVVTGDAADAWSEDEIRERMSGNLCRCGAYNNIIDAIRDVARGRE